MTARATIKQADIDRAVKAAQSAGVVVEIEPAAGVIRFIPDHHRADKAKPVATPRRPSL